jgi:hypothetical protein
VRASATAGAPCFGPASQTVAYEVRLHTHTATFGLAYKLGESPVVVKY